MNVDSDLSIFAQDNFVVVVQSVSNPNEKYYINLNVDTTRNNRVFINEYFKASPFGEVSFAFHFRGEQCYFYVFLL